MHLVLEVRGTREKPLVNKILCNFDGGVFGLQSEMALALFVLICALLQWNVENIVVWPDKERETSDIKQNKHKKILNNIIWQEKWKKK